MRRMPSRSIAAVSLLLAAAGVCAAERPRYGGTLRVEMQGTFDLPSSEVYETLVRLDDKGEPQPWLATGWVHDLAHKRWVFAPRPHVTFHNGAPWDPPGGSITVDDKEPIEDILRRLADPKNAIIQKTAEGAPVGTGPFRIAAQEPGKSVRLEAFDAYWGGRPFLDSVEVRMSRPLRDQALDLELGKADVIEVGLKRGSRIVLSRPDTVLALVAGRGVRETLTLAIDRGAIHSVLLQKQGESSGALLPQWLSGYAFVFPTARDLTRARQLAGQPRTLTFAYDRQDPLQRSIAERITLNAAEAGLTLRPAPPPADVRLVALRVAGLDPREALANLAAQLQVPLPEGDLYEAERAVIDNAGVIPLFHLPEACQLSPAVRNWTPRWRLADVWLDRTAAP
jgi:ABC-type transport system substrate-binding protein